MEKNRFWNYENKMVIIICLTFGFVMMDRQALNFLAPFALPDLGLNNTQFGLVISGFSLAWAVFGYLGSYISDVLGRKKVTLLIAVILFSTLSLSTGLVGGFISLAIVRFLMGVVEGPVMPIAQVIMIAESSPHRRGMNMGLMQSTAVALFATVLGPVILVALAEATTWRITFFLTIIPGLLLAAWMGKTLREPDLTKIPEDLLINMKEKVSPWVVFKNRNTILSFFISPFYIGWYLLIVSFTPLFLVNVKGVDPTTMSFIMASLGVGGVLFGFVIPMISDRVGRKPVFLVITLVTLCAPVSLLFVPKTMLVLMGILCFIGWSGVGTHPLYMSTIPGESVGAKNAATAIGMIMGAGELFGGAVGLAIAGRLSDMYSLSVVMYMAIAYIIISFILGLGYYETAPLKLAKKAAQNSVSAK